jgi:hypothetical protein
MNRLRLGILLPALLALLSGSCDRLAGTEVGNPEITLNARFSIRDTDTTADVPALNLKVMGMSWAMSYRAASCWNDTNGRMVDFAANAMPLDEVKVRDGEWSSAEMVLRAAPGDTSLPVASGFAAWSHPRYAKLVKIMGADTLRALFRMPENLQLRLIYGKASIKSWRQGAGMIVDVKFDAGKWAAGLGSNPAYRFRTDGNRARYLVLSPTENAAAYEAMKTLLPKAFMADSTSMF